MLLHCNPLAAEPIPVLHDEGTQHGFLVIRAMDGKLIASGDLTQTTKGDRVFAKLTFSFKDGSIDEETSVFRQRGVFTLVSDHHIQKGPEFPKPINVLIDVPAGAVTVRSVDHGKSTVAVHHMALPPDLVNGMTLTVLKNISPHTPETTVSFVAAAPDPRIVKLHIFPQGVDTFSVAGAHHTSERYDVKVELGGVAGFLAPIFGKEPQDTRVWVVGGAAPAFVRSEGPFYFQGPLWSIQAASPVWPSSDFTSGSSNEIKH